MVSDAWTWRGRNPFAFPSQPSCTTIQAAASAAKWAIFQAQKSATNPSVNTALFSLNADQIVLESSLGSFSSSPPSPWQPLLEEYNHDVAFPSPPFQNKGWKPQTASQGQWQNFASWQSCEFPGEDNKTKAMYLRNEKKEKPRLSNTSSAISEVSLKLCVSSRLGRVTLRSHPAMVFMSGNEILTPNSKSHLQFAHLKDITKIVSFVQCRTSCSKREKNCQKLNRQRKLRIPLHEQSISMIITEHSPVWEAGGPCCLLSTPISTPVRFFVLISWMVTVSHVSKILYRISRHPNSIHQACSWDSCVRRSGTILHSKRQEMLGWGV